MDVKGFQAWLSTASGLTCAQRRATALVGLGPLGGHRPRGR